MITFQEAVEIIGNAHIVTDTQEETDRILDAFGVIKKEAEKHKNGGWIPCSKRLPEYGDYLVTMQQGNVFHGKPFVNWASYDGDFYDSIDGKVFDNVIAWQPLPVAYKEDGVDVKDN